MAAVLTEKITEVVAPSPAPSPPQRGRGAKGRVGVPVAGEPIAPLDAMGSCNGSYRLGQEGVTEW